MQRAVKTVHMKPFSTSVLLCSVVRPGGAWCFVETMKKGTVEGIDSETDRNLPRRKEPSHQRKGLPDGRTMKSSAPWMLGRVRPGRKDLEEEGLGEKDTKFNFKKSFETVKKPRTPK